MLPDIRLHIFPHNNGVETRLIQIMLGHTIFQMTEIYIKSLIVEEELDSAAELIY